MDQVFGSGLIQTLCGKAEGSFRGLRIGRYRKQQLFEILGKRAVGITFAIAQYRNRYAVIGVSAIRTQETRSATRMSPTSMAICHLRDIQAQRVAGGIAVLEQGCRAQRLDRGRF